MKSSRTQLISGGIFSSQPPSFSFFLRFFFCHLKFQNVYLHGILHCEMSVTRRPISWLPLKHIPQVHRGEDDIDRAGHSGAH